MATEKRCLRIAEFIHQEIVEVLRKMEVPEKSLFTITKVGVNRDMRIAVVYFSVLGGEGERKAILSYLEEISPYLRREVGKRMRVRYIPRIRFRFDPSLEYSDRISELIEKVKKEREEIL
ncbi:MAG: 30S ribosome-binding factor RbfA [Candidatus Omnitrophota bacterium]|nr:MAG: 30S ribosome-binding factor RbfA [Candidatus Omnitrophota bacterium]